MTEKKLETMLDKNALEKTGKQYLKKGSEDK